MHIWNHFMFGLFLGWGAAIPIGPINIEIIRRNLRYGTSTGISFAMGACSADLTYFTLLLSGTLVFLQNESVLRIIGVLGSGILVWFGISAFRMRANDNDEKALPAKNFALWSHYFQGYALTLLNPITILFWASVSAQLVVLGQYGMHSVIEAGVGVLVGAVSWVIVINTVLHFTRHRLSQKTIHFLNCVGGIIILCFAAIGLWHALR